MSEEMPEYIYAVDGKIKRWFESWLTLFGKEEVPENTTKYVRYDVLKLDLDLPVAYRTESNLWQKKWLELHIELQAANKGLRRLSNKVKRLEIKFGGNDE